jgi:hypothetical protein
MTSADSRPVARLTSPGEMVALVPHLCGFVPSESLVVVSLRGPRRRVGLTLRIDLEACGDEPASAAEVAARVVHDGGGEVLLSVWTEADDGSRPARAGLVEAVTAALGAAGVGVHEALLVRAGRWWSYQCSNPRCCPAEGVPLDATESPVVSLLQATDAYDGRVVLPSRDDLVASLEPPGFLAAAAARQSLAAADETAAARILDLGVPAVRTGAVADFRAAVRAAVDPREQRGDALVAQLAVSLQDVVVRDEVLTWALAEPEPLLRVLHDLAGRTVAPYDVPVCTMLAIVAWLRGDGGLANVALDRAWRGDPTYSLAALVREGLHQQLPPSVVRDWLRSTQRALRPRRPTRRRRR